VKRDWIVSEAGADRSVVIDGPLADGRFRVTIDGVPREVDARRVRPGTWSLVIDGQSFTVDLDRRRDAVAASVGASEVVLTVEDALHRRLAQAAQAAQPRERTRGEALRAPIAGKMVKVLCAVGDAVAAGTAVCVLEAMKMENEIIAERGGTVTAVHKQPGQAVETGDLLVELA
jgi:acetyl-CoA/propionyl-CoA carboxylase biotin carboxyl carrier protein